MLLVVESVMRKSQIMYFMYFVDKSKKKFSLKSVQFEIADN